MHFRDQPEIPSLGIGQDLSTRVGQDYPSGLTLRLYLFLDLRGIIDVKIGMADQRWRTANILYRCSVQLRDTDGNNSGENQPCSIVLEEGRGARAMAVLNKLVVGLFVGKGFEAVPDGCRHCAAKL